MAFSSSLTPDLHHRGSALSSDNVGACFPSPPVCMLQSFSLPTPPSPRQEAPEPSHCRRPPRRTCQHISGPLRGPLSASRQKRVKGTSHPSTRFLSLCAVVAGVCPLLDILYHSWPIRTRCQQQPTSLRCDNRHGQTPP